MSDQRPLFAEDDDPRIVYSGSWDVVSPWKPGEYGNTAHITSQEGASATFRFQGTGVLFYISLPPMPAGVNGVMDIVVRLDDEVVPVQQVASGVRLYGQTAFNRQGLDDRVHELVVTNRMKPPYGEPLPLRFDGIEWRIPVGSEDVVPAPASPAPPSPSPSPSLSAEPEPSTPAPAPPQNSPTSQTASVTNPAASDPPPAQTSEGGSQSFVMSSIMPSVTTDERVVTKILPQEHVITLSDSTGSADLTLQTQSGAPPTVGGSVQLSTGTLIAVVLAVVATAALLVVGTLLLWKRGRKRRSAKGTDVASNLKDAEAERGHSNASPGVDPFDALLSRPPSLSWPSSTGTMEAGSARVEHSEKSRTGLPAVDLSPEAEEVAPPAYH